MKKKKMKPAAEAEEAPDILAEGVLELAKTTTEEI